MFLKGSKKKRVFYKKNTESITSNNYLTCKKTFFSKKIKISKKKKKGKNDIFLEHFVEHFGSICSKIFKNYEIV